MSVIFFFKYKSPFLSLNFTPLVSNIKLLSQNKDVNTFIYLFTEIINKGGKMIKLNQRYKNNIRRKQMKSLF